MIIYQLRCSKGHEFEAWFRDSKAYDAQAEAGDIVCPHCGETMVLKVSRELMGMWNKNVWEVE